jgi:outer membrane biosynthesis protein TonB
MPGRGNANAVEPVDYEMVALQDYLRRNARLPEAARQNNVSGFVRVSFRLNKNREPKNFKILHSLEYGCDEEAMRLLKAYDWRNFMQDTLTVEVPFVR